MLLFDWCVSDDPFFGHGNAFHAAGGRGTKRAQLRHLLRVLRRLTTLSKKKLPAMLLWISPRFVYVTGLYVVCVMVVVVRTL